MERICASLPTEGRPARPTGPAGGEERTDRTERGFTLLEVVLVLAFVAILSVSFASHSAFSLGSTKRELALAAEARLIEARAAHLVNESLRLGRTCAMTVDKNGTTFSGSGCRGLPGEPNPAPLSEGVHVKQGGRVTASSRGVITQDAITLWCQVGRQDPTERPVDLTVGRK